MGSDSCDNQPWLVVLDQALTGGGLHARTRAQCGREPLRFVLVASAVFRDSYVRVICERACVRHSHIFELYTWKRPSQFQDTSSSSVECSIIVCVFSGCSLEQLSLLCVLVGLLGRAVIPCACSSLGLLIRAVIPVCSSLLREFQW